MRGRANIPLLLDGRTYMPGHFVESDDETMARLESRGIVECEHPLESMTRGELAKLAKSRGIAVSAKDTKAGIIGKLEG